MRIGQVFRYPLKKDRKKQDIDKNYEGAIKFRDPEEILFDTEGRIRNIVSAPDGTLVIATDGPNGKLLRVVPNN